MEAIQALELHHVPFSIDIEKAGDFAFVPKKEPLREITRTPMTAPTGFFKPSAHIFANFECVGQMMPCKVVCRE
jgi:hypothetical protein